MYVDSRERYRHFPMRKYTIEITPSTEPEEDEYDFVLTRYGAHIFGTTDALEQGLDKIREAIGTNFKEDPMDEDE